MSIGKKSRVYISIYIYRDISEMGSAYIFVLYITVVKYSTLQRSPVGITVI